MILSPKDIALYQLVQLQHITLKQFDAIMINLLETSGWTNIFIYPGFDFKAIDGQITNFHLPKSTLVNASIERLVLMKMF